MHGSALVGRGGSIDWCCIPRFDSAAFFSRILDSTKGGFFKLWPTDVVRSSRRYLPNTNILETSFTTGTGSGFLLDFMPVHRDLPPPRNSMETTGFQGVVRILQCTRGRLGFEMECRPRFDYGKIVPHSSLSNPNTGMAHGGSDAVSVYCSSGLSMVNDGFQADGEILEAGSYTQPSQIKCRAHIALNPYTRLNWKRNWRTPQRSGRPGQLCVPSEANTMKLYSGAHLL